MILQLILGTTSSDPTLGVVALEWVFKILFVVAAALYVMFAFVVTRQIHVMKSTLITTFSPIVQLIGYVHLAVSILVLLLFIML
ncbi:MAG TPA: DUF5657 family protein [Patescibacteria group bacterium]